MDTLSKTSTKNKTNTTHKTRYCCRVVSVLILSFFCLHVWSVKSVAEEEFNCFGEYTATRSALEKKGVVLYEERGSEGSESIVGITLIKSAPSNVWNWVTDWALISEKVTGVDYYKIIHNEETANKNEWSSIIEARLGLPLVKIYYYLNVSFNKDTGGISWHLVDETEQAGYRKIGLTFDPPNSERIKNIAGKSTMDAVSENETLYCYAPIVEVNGNVPGFIRRFLSETMLKSYLITMKKDLEV